MLHIIGIGYKKEHITFEQLGVIKKSKKVYLEYYTSFYQDDFKELEDFLGKEIVVCNRDVIENKIEDKIIKPAKDKDISLLILGDPLIATTHSDLLLRAKKLNIKTKIYHNVSIGNFVTRCGLQFYKFGKITSIPFFSEKFIPRTPYMVLLDNIRIGAHSLLLLDLNPSDDSYYKSDEKYLKASDALQFLLDIQNIMYDNEEIMENDIKQFDEESDAIICSKLGFDDEKIIFSKVKDLIEYDKKYELEEPICLIIPGDLHDMEIEFLEQFRF